MDSCGAGKLHVCRWSPEGSPIGIVQIVHGISEHVMRYDAFARYLTQHGFLVVAEDHMGHGASMEQGSVKGYFHGGWKAAVEDVYNLMQQTMLEYPGVPYILFGHSMGSFLSRTLLIDHSDCGISGCILSGTAWMPEAALVGGYQLCRIVCMQQDERLPSKQLETLAFGGYNKGFDHPRTAFDWVSRDPRQVDAYIADPWCGFTASAGLYRDMMGGIRYNQKRANLARMNPKLPVHFIAGGDDPVGNCGKGVRKAAQKFRNSGMSRVSCRIYPLCRHEILRELNAQEIFQDLVQWIEQTALKKENINA